MAKPSLDACILGTAQPLDRLLPAAARLAQLRAQLQAVEFEIEQETQAAIQWIRPAMHDYGITIAELRSR